MNMKNSNKAVLAIVLILLAASSRLIDHMANFTPVLAIAIFGGALLKRQLAYVLPLAIMLISDFAIELIRPGEGFYPGQIYVYISFLLVAALSSGVLRKRNRQPEWILGTSLGSSLVFFLVSNFGAWVSLPMYEKSFSGLLMCYQNAIPFMRGEVLSTLLFSGILFGMYHLSTAFLFKAAEKRA